MTSRVDLLDHTGFETTVAYDVVADEAFVKRDGGTLVGVAAADITAGSASAITTTTGPTVLTIAAIDDTEILTRSGATIDGVLPSAMTVGTATLATNANGLRETGGPANLPMGAVAEGTWFRRSAGAVVGASTALLATLVKPELEGVTAVPDATYSWNSAAFNLGVTHAAAACDITLPDETQTAFWAVGETRLLFKQNVSVFGINLVAPANIVINGAAAGTDAAPITGSLLVPAIAVNAPFWRIYRASATAFWILGYAT